MSTHSRVERRFACVVAATLVALLGGCATFSDDGGFAPVAETAKRATGQEARWARRPADLESIERRRAKAEVDPSISPAP